MKRLRRFHADERGMEVMQVVMIVAIAALVIMFIKVFWYDIKNWVAPLLANVVGWKSE